MNHGLKLHPDGTLEITMPKGKKVGRVLVCEAGTQNGSLYYPERDVPDINVGDINKFIDGLEEIFADLRERHVDDSVCGLCEYDGAYLGQSGDWCNECPGFEKDDCFKLSGKIRKEWTDEIIKALPSAESERKTGKWIHKHCVWFCSKCGENPTKGMGYVQGHDELYDFCPKCGADMRQGEDDNV